MIMEFSPTSNPTPTPRPSPCPLMKWLGPPPELSLFLRTTAGIVYGSLQLFRWLQRACQRGGQYPELTPCGWQDAKIQFLINMTIVKLKPNDSCRYSLHWKTRSNQLNLERFWAFTLRYGTSIDMYYSERAACTLQGPASGIWFEVFCRHILFAFCRSITAFEKLNSPPPPPPSYPLRAPIHPPVLLYHSGTKLSVAMGTDRLWRHRQTVSWVWWE